MRNLVFVALLATAALSMGCNGIHKRHGGCGPGGCGGGGCPGGACGAYGDAYAGGGCPDGACGAYGHGGHGGLHNGHGMPGHGGPGGGQHGMHGVPHHFSREYNGPPGPPAAQVGYPYYTTRGPRDFFFQGPSTIGP